MNEMTQTDIANLALSTGARKGAINDLNSDTSTSAIQARLFYKKAMQKILSSYPWPTLTKRVKLERVEGKKPVASYDYYYRPPRDAAFIWDFYPSEYSYRGISPIWNYTIYSFYSFPQVRGSVLIDKVGEIVDDYFASSHVEMHCLYTPKPADLLSMDIGNVTNQFIDCLILEMQEWFEEGSGTSDPSMYRAKTQRREDKKSEAKTLSAIENRKGYSIPGSTVVDSVANYLWR